MIKNNILSQHLLWSLLLSSNINKLSIIFIFTIKNKIINVFNMYRLRKSQFYVWGVHITHLTASLSEGGGVKYKEGTYLLL